MIEIDGSYGEGGGQILRTAVSLSALTLRPIRIKRIRAGRPKPGLKRQHIAGIELTARLVNAKVKGLEIGSETVEFIPSERLEGTFEYDVGTAGSISLVLQAVLPPAILSRKATRFHLKGGTDVSWSPPIDYMREVFAFMLEKLGPKVTINQERRGHYPKGGGKVSVDIIPCERILPVSFVGFGELNSVSGISHCVRLPSHVAERQAASAERVLIEGGLPCKGILQESYQMQNDPHLGAGSGIVLWAESDVGMRVGTDSLGARGKRAEAVGAEAASQLIKELSTKNAIDSHLCDMLIPYLALGEGESCLGVTEVTSHLTTNIWVANRILGVEIDLQGEVGEPGLVRIKGIGFSLT